MDLTCSNCGNDEVFHASQICEQVIRIGGDGAYKAILSIPEIFKTKDVICPICETPYELTDKEELEIGK